VRSAYSQEHFTTIIYSKFGGQTECIMGNWKIENKGTLVPRVFVPLDQQSENERLWEQPFQACA